MRLFLAIAIFLLSAPAWAHKPSDSYLLLAVKDSQAEGQWDIALRDLDYAIGLDADDVGAITWGKVRARHDAIASYALSHLTLHADNRPCPTAIADQLITSTQTGPMQFCDSPQPVRPLFQISR